MGENCTQILTVWEGKGDFFFFFVFHPRRWLGRKCQESTAFKRSDEHQAWHVGTLCSAGCEDKIFKMAGTNCTQLYGPGKPLVDLVHLCNDPLGAAACVETCGCKGYCNAPWLTSPADDVIWVSNDVKRGQGWRGWYSLLNRSIGSGLRVPIYPSTDCVCLLLLLFVFF